MQRQFSVSAIVGCVRNKMHIFWNTYTVRELKEAQIGRRIHNNLVENNIILLAVHCSLDIN